MAGWIFLVVRPLFIDAFFPKPPAGGGDTDLAGQRMVFAARNDLSTNAFLHAFGDVGTSDGGAILQRWLSAATDPEYANARRTVDGHWYLPNGTPVTDAAALNLLQSQYADAKA